jgi:1-acyl-sn-glycerol-3-phosphate acyltransferase
LLLRKLFYLLVVKPFLKAIVGVRYVGREHVPPDDPVLVVSNHNSHLDAVALTNIFPIRRLSRVRPVAAQDYFDRGFKAWFASTIMHVLPILRRGFTEENHPLKIMGDALDAGTTLILFPEGSRGEPEVMQPFKSGVARLLETRPTLRVLPCFCRGLGKALPRGDAIPLPVNAEVRIGPPRTYQGTAEEILARIEADVRALG